MWRISETIWPCCVGFLVAVVAGGSGSAACVAAYGIATATAAASPAAANLPRLVSVVLLMTTSPSAPLVRGTAIHSRGYQPVTEENSRVRTSGPPNLHLWRTKLDFRRPQL